MLPSETREIGGKKFKCTKFPAMAAFDLLHAIVKAGGAEAIDLLSRDSDAVSSSMIMLMRLNAEQRDCLVFEILRGTGVETAGKFVELTDKDNVNIALGADVTLLFRAIRFALEVNFGGFSDAVASLLKPAKGDGDKAEASSSD